MLEEGTQLKEVRNWGCALRNTLSLATTPSSLPLVFLSPSCLSQVKALLHHTVSLSRCSIQAHRTEPLWTELSKTRSRNKVFHLYIVCQVLSSDNNNLTNIEEERKERRKDKPCPACRDAWEVAYNVPRNHPKAMQWTEKGNQNAL